MIFICILFSSCGINHAIKKTEKKKHKLTTEILNSFGNVIILDYGKATISNLIYNTKIDTPKLFIDAIKSIDYLERLLLVLPDKEIYDYLCTGCANSVGQREVTAGELRQRRPVPRRRSAP